MAKRFCSSNRFLENYSLVARVVLKKSSSTLCYLGSLGVILFYNLDVETETKWGNSLIPELIALEMLYFNRAIRVITFSWRVHTISHVDNLRRFKRFSFWNVCKAVELFKIQRLWFCKPECTHELPKVWHLNVHYSDCRSDFAPFDVLSLSATAAV